jgi:hypothetical protein
VVPGLLEVRWAGSRNLRRSLEDCPVVRIVQVHWHMTLCLEVAHRSPDLVGAGAFACCAVAVAEMVGCQVLHMNMVLQIGQHLREQQCCIALA